jgi:hypothetical protein
LRRDGILERREEAPHVESKIDESIIVGNKIDRSNIDALLS